MSNYKNALKIQDLIQKNKDLECELRLNTQLHDIEKTKRRNLENGLKNYIEKYETLEKEHNELVAEMEILKQYFKLKLLL